MDNNVTKIAANANFFIKNNPAAQKSDKKTEEKHEEGAKTFHEQKNPDAIYNAMNLAGLQNMAMVSGPTRVNPKDYLNEESINGIAAAMANFEAANEETLNAMNEEFSGMPEWENMSEAAKLALAAKANEIA